MLKKDTKKITIGNSEGREKGSKREREFTGVVCESCGNECPLGWELVMLTQISFSQIKGGIYFKTHGRDRRICTIQNTTVKLEIKTKVNTYQIYLIIGSFGVE